MGSLMWFDLEADGLLYDATKVWCMVGLADDTYHIWHIDTDEEVVYPKNYKLYSLEEYISLLSTYTLVAHNGIGYDFLLLEKLYNTSFTGEDTFILSCLYNPDRVWGHSLEGWGDKLGCKKGSHSDWSRFSPEMLSYCVQDVDVLKRVWYALEQEADGWDWSASKKLEYAIADVMARQELHGVLFDKPKAEALYLKLEGEVAEIEEKALKEIPSKVVQVGAVINEPFKKDGSYRQNVQEWIDDGQRTA